MDLLELKEATLNVHLDVEAADYVTWDLDPRGVFTVKSLWKRVHPGLEAGLVQRQHPQAQFHLMACSDHHLRHYPRIRSKFV